MCRAGAPARLRRTIQKINLAIPNTAAATTRTSFTTASGCMPGLDAGGGGAVMVELGAAVEVGAGDEDDKDNDEGGQARSTLAASMLLLRFAGRKSPCAQALGVA